MNLVALSGTTATRYSDSETSYSSDTNAFKLRKFYGKAMTYISSNKTLIILLPSAAGKTGAYAGWGGGGGALGARAPPPPGKKVQKCPKEERKLRSDMWSKKNVHVPLGYDKIKTKKAWKKEDISKRKGIKSEK